VWVEKGAGINVPPGPQVGWTGAPPVFGVHSDWTHRLSRALSRRSGSRDLLAPRPQVYRTPTGAEESAWLSFDLGRDLAVELSLQTPEVAAWIETVAHQPLLIRPSWSLGWQCDT
jgi:hypothetical protein